MVHPEDAPTQVRDDRKQNAEANDLIPRDIVKGIKHVSGGVTSKKQVTELEKEGPEVVQKRWSAVQGLQYSSVLECCSSSRACTLLCM